ncbi:MAG TPA: response regulator [Candidatus Binataceae bacterium]|nr:response regulator [Candidatus Binataceae bacterium]
MPIVRAFDERENFMQAIAAEHDLKETTERRATELYDEMRQRDYYRTDRMFACLMVLQWIGGIIAALVISPRAWAGEYSSTHIHVWAAIFLGGAITLVPVTMALEYPGQALTRHAIAIGQMLMSALLIHLTGGRIETHFHVFGSLAFLAFYRDWKVLISATIVVAIDHFARGMFWPQSVYGVAFIEPWRWVEHAAWVAFEDVFLIISVVQVVKDKMGMALQQARLETVNSEIEAEVVLRTTELRRSEAQLKQSETKLRKIFDACPETIIITRMRDGHYIDANHRVGGLGYSLEEMRQNPEPGLTWANRVQLLTFVNELNQHEVVQNMEVEFKSRDGVIVPGLISGAVVELEGERCAVTFSSDITRLKQTERDLIAAREAALAASRAKSEFLSSMSHEIRTPMNAILGMADLLAETPLQPEQRKFVATMTSNGNALLTLINGILDLARIESGRLNLEQTEFEIEELIEHVAETLGVRAHEKKLELTTRILPGTPACLIGDPLRLRQVLINLVGNAIKFTERGEVAITVGGEAAPSGEVGLRFSVRDTGIGIAPDKLQSVFQSFTQADSSATRKYGGTGLGLTIASRLVALMGGRIEVNSEPGKGSTFEFVARLRVAESQELATEPPLSLVNVRVLLVDDNPTNLLILHETLRTLGAEIAQAESGKDALEKARHADETGKPFQLVILDCRMPEMDGFQVAAELRRMTTSGPPPIVLMLSSDDLNRSLESARATGIEVYILKPVRRTELFRAIARALNNDRDQNSKPLPITSPAPKNDEDIRPLNILIAEDSPDNLRVIQAYLKNLPYRLDHAEDGEIAVTKFIAGKYDLVLMDMQMPVLDGYDAVRQIRRWESENGKAPTPIAALTASALEEDVKNTIEAGCTSHLSKPIKKARLLPAIRELTATPAASAGNGHSANVVVEPVPQVMGFLERKRQDVYALTAALERADYHALRTIATRTKGEGTSFGFAAISDIGGALEQAALERDVAGVHHHVRALAEYLDQVEVRSSAQS